MMMYYLLGAMVVVSIVLVVYAFWPNQGQDDEAIKRRMSGHGSQSSVAELRRQAKESVAKRVVDSVAPIAVRQSTTENLEEMSKLRIKLATAGLRDETSVTRFLASKTIIAVLLAIAAAVFVWAKGLPFQNAIGIVMIAAGAGFLAPNLWLSSAASKRKQEIRMGLPDTLDMLVISVEAGLGLDAAFQRVGDEMRKIHPTLAEELQLVTMETQMGIPRSEALSNFGTRSGLDEARSLVAIINQAERFGTSIARALRNQSDALRVKRRQAAEERAQKTAVKLMAPLILFIFPAILVVLAGPAALKMIETLSKTPGLL
ncbi:MAG: type II secretion system F family protein [Planctomycetes bacterium]|nr:type II secretion system F family protein [Planctomycetota bacterium]MCH7631863.1 type II secretion system F family protein [Planctomycetota bacterium]